MDSYSGVDEENEEDERMERAPSPGVKSRAVVKYASEPGPVHFARLQCNTDLKRPPASWRPPRLLRDPGLASFRMAHTFPDCVGEVDVIAGAECIKNLLKLPYGPHSGVSLAVHRVRNTLLLDEFDARDFLLKSEWPWLRTFLHEAALEPPPTGTELNPLADKFLCHSVDQTPASIPEPRPEQPPPADEYSRNVLWTFEDIQMLIGSNLPIFGSAERPCVSLRLRDATRPINVLTGIDYWLDNLMCNVPEVLMCYHIDGIVQKYEPMKTEELPNLEGSKFSPKVIRNVAQNILSFLKSNATKSGHTYWLFKGARDDVVKLYDLTSLCGGLGAESGDDNPYTTPVGMLLYRVARNMRLAGDTSARRCRQLLDNALSLLRPEAHPHVVASAHYTLADLYLPPDTDPAAPCFTEEGASDTEEEFDDDADQERGSKEPGESTRRSDVTTKRTEDSARTEESKGSRESSPDANQLALQDLSLHDIGSVRESSQGKSKSARGGSLCTSPPERCGRALHHALLALRALQYIHENDAEGREEERRKQQRVFEEQNLKMANPYEPISMDYRPLSGEQATGKGAAKKRKRRVAGGADRNAISVRTEKAKLWREPPQDDAAQWKRQLFTLLCEKVCLAYATLAEYSYTREQYGFSLKYIALAALAQAAGDRRLDASCLAGRAGDSYLQLSKQWSRLEQFRAQLETDHVTDSGLRDELRSHVVTVSSESEPKLPRDVTESMELACAAYARALRLCEPSRRHELLRRQASVTNELAVKYMHRAQDVYMQYASSVQAQQSDTGNDAEKAKLLQQHRDLLKESERRLDAATAMFEEVNDAPNLALLYCNKARYMRLRAHCPLPDDAADAWRRRYDDAEELYTLSLSCVSARGGQASGAVRDLVAWERSSAAYARAQLRQERAESVSEAQEVIDTLKQALKQCDLSPGTRQHLYQFRAAMIQHSLGAIYHKLYRECGEEGPRKRSLASLTRSHYTQACSLLAVLHDTATYLTVALEHVALLEQHAADTGTRLKSLQEALQLMVGCGSIVQLVATDTNTDVNISHVERDEAPSADESALLSLLTHRLQYVLKSLMQHTRARANKDYERLAQAYKLMYAESLRLSASEKDSLRERAVALADTLQSLDEISRQHSL